MYPVKQVCEIVLKFFCRGWKTPTIGDWCYITIIVNTTQPDRRDIPVPLHQRKIYDRYANLLILQIGPIKIYSYGLMMAMAFLVAGFLLRRELKRAGLPVDMGDLIVIGAVLGGIIGAKLYSLIENLDDPDALSLRSFFSGAGLVWYGGFIGGTIAVVAIIHLKRAPLLETLDLLAPMLILGYAFGRMGCFLSGDGCYGPPTDLPWGMAFPNGTVPTLERVHPAPLYEITMSLVIFAFLWKRGSLLHW